MLAGAFRQYLETQGMARVTVGQFGDHSGSAAVALHVSNDDDADLDDGTYNARLQIRARARGAIEAENTGRQAFELVLAADGSTLNWVDPTGGPARAYRVEAIRVVNRPTWYATPEPGEETSCNLRLLVTET